VLGELADRLEGRLQVDPEFAGDLAAARELAVSDVVKGLGPYQRLVDSLQRAVGRDYNWVRDVTISNSTWGNRQLRLAGPRDGVHALGGGIGLGLPMAVGAALAARDRKIAALCGDGGLMLNLGELATAVQERADLVLLVMNDRGYGVIRNIQDARYDGRHYFADLHTPDLEGLARGFGLAYRRIADLDAAADVLRAAVAAPGPSIVEVDMTAIGPFASAFAGPPVRKPT
jgi:acetolactate synthase-1/2/3 large subunit